MYRWFGFASRHAREALAGFSSKSSSRILSHSDRLWIHLKGPNSLSMPSSLPIFSVPRVHFATKRKGPPPKQANDDFDDDDEDSDFEDEDDDLDYEWDYETWNLLHQGKKEGEKSRRRPLPMYKAREMVDYHMIKNRLDGLEVITDPKLEEELRKTLHEGLVDFYKRTQAAFDEIDAEHKKEKELLEGDQKKEALESSGNEIDAEHKKEKESLEGDQKKEALGSSGNETKNLETADGGESQEHEKKVGMEGEAAADNSEPDAGLQVTDSATDEVPNEEGKTNLADGSADIEAEIASMETFIEDAVKEIMISPESDTINTDKGELRTVEPKEEEVDDDAINVFDYDKWTAFRKEEISKQMAKKDEEQKNCPTLRWKTQLVLGPGDAWHPANRKATVSVYVKELGLSKYSKMRLLALAGKRYKAPKDELTVVGERFQHRYENQKDVLRTLLDLIEEAKKADKLVNDARIDFMKAKQSDVSPTSKPLGTEATVSVSSV